MKCNIIAITGLSGSGKSTLAKEISKILSIPVITTATTRPIRPGEKHGIDYIFYNEKTYNDLYKNGKIIANENFKVADGSIYKYGILKCDLEKYNRVIIVLTPQGVKDLKALGYNVLSIYSFVDEDERINRIIKRKDNQTKQEIMRRGKEDKIKFRNFNPSYVINNNNKVEYAANQASDFIIDNIMKAQI